MALPTQQLIRPGGYQAGSRWFGYYADAHKDHLVISAQEDPADGYTDRVYLYRRDASGAYAVLDSIDDPEAGTNHRFGHRVAVFEKSSTDVLIAITAPYFGTGRVYMYRWNGFTTTHEDDFSPGTSTQFGVEGLACGDNFVAVGHTHEPQADDQEGKVYFYEKSGGTWGTAGSYTPLGRPNYTVYRFGSSIAIDRTYPQYILIGGQLDYYDDVDWSWSGGAYLVERTAPTTYVIKDTIFPSEFYPYADNRRYRFGNSVDIDIANGRLVIGTFKVDTSPQDGGAYIYDGSVGSWAETFLKPSDTDEAGQNARGLAGLGAVALADGRQVNTATSNGFVYVFKKNGSWVQEEKLPPTGSYMRSHGAGTNATEAHIENTLFVGPTATCGKSHIIATASQDCWYTGTDYSGSVNVYEYDEGSPAIPPDITPINPLDGEIGVAKDSNITFMATSTESSIVLDSVDIWLKGVLIFSGGQEVGEYAVNYEAISTGYLFVVSHKTRDTYFGNREIVTIRAYAEDGGGSASESWSFETARILNLHTYPMLSMGVRTADEQKD